MDRPDNAVLRKVINTHLGPKVTEATQPQFEKTKTELIFTKTALTKAISHLTMPRYLELVADPSEGTAAENNATSIVDDYFIPLPSETINGGFDRAKKESMAKLRNEVSQLKYFSFKDYGFKKRKKTSTKKKRATNFDTVRVERKRIT